MFSRPTQGQSCSVLLDWSGVTNIVGVLFVVYRCFANLIYVLRLNTK